MTDSKAKEELIECEVCSQLETTKPILCDFGCEHDLCEDCYIKLVLRK